MSELISKEQALSYPLSYEHYDKVHGSKKFINGVENYREYIDGLPTVEERRHGHWLSSKEHIPKTTYKGIHYFCSNCDAVSRYTTPFCWNCGSIMNEVSEDER